MLKEGGADARRPAVVRRRRSRVRRRLAAGRRRLRLRAARGVAVSRDVPKDEDELIVPAREGALRVLRAARDAGVKRVVLTSSFAAIGYGQPLQSAPFDENELDRSGRRRRARLT